MRHCSRQARKARAHEQRSAPVRIARAGVARGRSVAAADPRGGAPALRERDEVVDEPAHEQRRAGLVGRMHRGGAVEVDPELEGGAGVLLERVQQPHEVVVHPHEAPVQRDVGLG